MNQTIEKTTLSNLVFNEDYCRKVIPFIKPIYFANRDERIVFEEINPWAVNDMFYIDEKPYYLLRIPFQGWEW